MRHAPLKLVVISLACVAIAACAPPRRAGGGALGGGGGGNPGGDNGAGQGDDDGDGDVQEGGGNNGDAAGKPDDQINDDQDAAGDPGDGDDDADDDPQDGDDEGDDEQDPDGGDGNASCEDILACAVGCDEIEECILSCRRTGSLGAQADFAGLYACAVDAQCSLSDVQCLGMQCGDEGLDCGIEPIRDGEGGDDEGDPPDGGDDDDDPPGGSSCGDALLCGSRCGAADQACQSDCLLAAEGDDRWLLSNVLACQQFTCDNDPDCVRAECGEHAEACQAGAEGVGLTCGGVFACASIFCAAGGGAPDQACVAQCQSAMDRGERPALQGLSACMQENRCEDQACIDDNCPEQADLCFDRAE